MLRGAGEARWAHNPKDGGSKPLGAMGRRKPGSSNYGYYHPLPGGLAQIGRAVV